MRRQSRQHVLVFLYRDVRSTGDILAAVGRLPGVQRTAAIARPPAGVVRIEASPRSGATTLAGDPVTGALGEPSPGPVHRLEADDRGLASFLDLVPAGNPVLLVAVCTPGTVDAEAIAGSVRQLLRAAGEPQGRALHVSAAVEDQPRMPRSTRHPRRPATPPTLGRAAASFLRP